jgi:hypothetical protein
MVEAAYPDLPEAVLRVYFEHQADPTAADLQAVLGGNVALAEQWRKLLHVWLVSPGYYVDLFAAEDVVSERHRQGMSYQDDCRATAQRLQELQGQIEATLAYRHSLRDPVEQAEVQAKLDDLDAARVMLLRHQGDLPGAGTRIEAAMTEAKAALEEAQTVLKEVQVTWLGEVEQAWLAEVQTLSWPEVLALLRLAKHLDERWKALGVDPGMQHGSRLLKETLLHQLRQA